MSRAILPFSSILFTGVVGTLLYSNFSMAQLDIPEGKTIGLNWELPRIDIVVEYNERSVEEDASSVSAVQAEKERGKVVEKVYRSPDIVEIKKTVVGDDVNSSELVDHYGFPSPDVEEIRTIDLTSYVDGLHLKNILVKLDEEEPLEQRGEDSVSFGNASSKKDSAPSGSKEMIFIDYSKKSPTSSPVGKKKSALLAQTSLQATPPVQKTPKKEEVLDGKGTSLSSPLLSLASVFIENEFFRRMLRVHSATDGRGLNFQFVPDHDKEQVFSSDEKGVVDIFSGKRLVDGLLRGRIISPEHMRTVVNLPVFREEGASFDIPLIDEVMFDGYGRAREDAQGGHLLVWISKKVEDVDIGSDYSSRIFLDREFREIPREDGYSYVLFMGIQSGVTILSSLLEDGGVAEKLVHISEDEVLYDFASVEKAHYETFELYQKNLFSGKSVELPLGEEQVHYFNREILPVKKGLNYYEIRKPPTLKGARNYLKLEHLDGILHVGYKTNRRLEVPNQDFIENIIDGFGKDDLSDSCLLQLNFSAPLVHFKVNLDSFQESDEFDLIYLNSDGSFEQMPSLRTEKAFILAESPGVFAAGVQYSNDRWGFFKSFCSLGSYLIEQL